MSVGHMNLGGPCLRESCVYEWLHSYITKSSTTYRILLNHYWSCMCAFFSGLCLRESCTYMYAWLRCGSICPSTIFSLTHEVREPCHLQWYWFLYVLVAAYSWRDESIKCRVYVCVCVWLQCGAIMVDLSVCMCACSLDLAAAFSQNIQTSLHP